MARPVILAFHRSMLLASLPIMRFKQFPISVTCDRGCNRVPASALDPVQRQLLAGLVDEYLGDASDEASARQRAAIAADGADKLHFAWRGPTGDPAARFMFRIEGPSIIIDYVRERSPDGSFNHAHSIARDPANDYGAKWLEQHYTEAHQE